MTPTIREGDSERQDGQRRSYFRTPIQLSLAIHADAAYRILLLEDLSGGGCRCRIESDDEFVVGEMHVCSLNLDDGDAPLKMDLTVVRAEPTKVAFQFAVIRERERQRILQTLFREYRAKRAATRATTGADGPSGADGVSG